MNDLTAEYITQEVHAAATAKGFTIKMEYSETESNPRKMCEVSSKLVSGTTGRLSNIADIKIARDLCGNSLERNIANYARAYGVKKSDMLIWGVYTYEHGDIALSTTPFSCSFDGACSGFIYESKKELYAEYNVKRITKQIKKKIEQRIQSELLELEQWANGEVGELILMKDGEEVSWLGGLYSPNVAYVTEMAVDMINDYSAQECAA